MSFLEGTFIADGNSATILNYSSYPTSTKPAQTTALLNQLVNSLEQQQSGAGDFMVKSIDGDSITTALNLKCDKSSYNNVDNTSDLNKPLSYATISGLLLKCDKTAYNNVDNTSDLNKPLSTAAVNELNLKCDKTAYNNVDNTSDLNKPISYLTLSGLLLKCDKTSYNNVDNTSDLNKPLSTASINALNLKANLTSNTFTGINTFNNYAPVCSVTPTTNSMLVNKKYIDDNCLLLSGNQVMTGTKTFNNIVVTGTQTETGNMIIGDSINDSLTINSTITLSGGVYLTPSQLSKVQYLDINSNITGIIDSKTTLTGIQNNNNVWTGNNSFNNYLPTSILTPSLSSQLITKAYCDDKVAALVNSSPSNLDTLNELSNAIASDPNFSTTMTNLIGTKASLNNNNDLLGLNTYYQLPILYTDISATNNKHLISKLYADTTYSKISGNNTYTGVQSFGSNVIIGDGVGGDTMTINCNILTNTHTLTPATLARVRFISDINSSVSSQLASKASLANANTFTGTQVFDNTCEFKDNIIVNGHNLTPLELKNVMYLDVNSSVNDSLNSKMSKTTGDTNTIYSNNIFQALPLVWEGLSPHDLPNPDVALLHYGFAKDIFCRKANDNAFTAQNNTFDYSPKINNALLDCTTDGTLIHRGYANSIYAKLTASSNIFSALPLIATNITPNNEKQLVPLKYLVDEYSKLNTNNNYIGINSYYEMVRLYANLIVDSKTITPAMLGQTEHLSTVTSNIQDQINSKTSLSTVLSSSNTFTNQNVFNGVTIYGNDVNMRDLFLTGAVNRTLQWTNASDTVLGKIECDVTSQEMSITTPQTKDIKFVSGSTVVAKVNKTGTPTDANDLCIKSYVDKNVCLPSVFTYGNNAQTATAMDLTGGQIFLNFTTSRVIQNVTFELSYHVNYSNQNSMNINTTHYNFNAIYNLIYSSTNNAYYLRLSDGTSTILNVSSSLKPWQLGLSNGRLSLTYQLLATGSNNNPANGAWISSFSIGCRILNSYTGGNRFLSPNSNNSLNSDVGSCYISLT